MIIEQIYTGCFSAGAYYIESNGSSNYRSISREVQDYINKASKKTKQK
jgi:hypothetical protein